MNMPPPPTVTIRYNPVLGTVLLVIGLLNLLLAIAAEGFTMGWFAGIALTLLGLCYVFGTAAVIQPHLVQIKSPAQITMKSEPIHGFEDLIVDKSTLVRRGDGKKLLNMGWGTVGRSDLDLLRRTVGWHQ